MLLLAVLVGCAQSAQNEPSPLAQVERTPVGMQEAISKGLPIKCISEQAGQTATVYFKDGLMRMDTTPVGAHAIYTKDTIYSWMNKQGTMMKLADVERMAQKYGSKVQTKDDVVMQNTNAKCTQEAIDDKMFVPPSDVEFQDMTEMLKQVEQMANGYS